MDVHERLPELPPREADGSTSWGLSVMSLSVLSTFTLLLALAVYGAGRNLWLLAFLALPLAFAAAAIATGVHARRHVRPASRRR